MLNKVWFWLLVVGIVYGLVKGGYQSWVDSRADLAVAAVEAEQADDTAAGDTEAAAETPARGLLATGKAINEATLEAADLSVEICIGLIGILALWMGILQIASDAGLVDALARALRPVMRFLFPEIPDGHPAQGAILMNFSANFLGLENAATPMGLKAMQELQKLNATADTATNSMAMFLAINTSNITLIPFTIIGYRHLAGSEQAAEPLMGTLVVTTFATIVAIIAASWLSRLPRYQLSEAPTPGEDSPTALSSNSSDEK